MILLHISNRPEIPTMSVLISYSRYFLDALLTFTEKGGNYNLPLE